MATIANDFGSTWTPRALAALRIVTGYTFLLHGTAKLFGAPHVAMFDELQLFSLYGLAGMLEVVGEDNVMIEMDYPHSDSTWPHSLKLAHERLDAAGLTDLQKYKILRGNAEKLYHFTPATPPEVVRR